MLADIGHEFIELGPLDQREDVGEPVECHVFLLGHEAHLGENSCSYRLDDPAAADVTVRFSALAASTLMRLVSGLGCASVSTEAEGLLATGEQAVVMRLHIRPRENPLCG